MKQDDKRWEQLKDLDLEEWRGHPVSLLLRDWLTEQERVSLNSAMNLSFVGDRRAPGYSGQAQAFNLMIQSAFIPRPAPPPTAQDDTFRDPATRPSTLKTVKP